MNGSSKISGGMFLAITFATCPMAAQSDCTCLWLEFDDTWQYKRWIIQFEKIKFYNVIWNQAILSFMVHCFIWRHRGVGYGLRYPLVRQGIIKVIKLIISMVCCEESNIIFST